VTDTGNTANIMFNDCVVGKYEINPQTCQACGAQFVYLREQPRKTTQRPTYCPNCGKKNVGGWPTDWGPEDVARELEGKTGKDD
jgi:hypothetical protein